MGKKIFLVGVVCLILLGLLGCGHSTTPKNPPTILSFYASPSEIEAGEYTMLHWSTLDADSVYIDHGVGRVSLSGEASLWLGETSTVTLTASNKDGTVTDQVVVTLVRVAKMVLSGTPQKKMESFGCPYFDGYVKNTGDATGYNVMIQFRAYSDTAKKNIIDTASGFPADLGNIGPGQRARFDATFFNLSSWDQVKAWDYEISWLNVSFGPGAIRVKTEGEGF